MIDPHPILYCGRSFSSEDLALMRQAARECAGLGVTEIARTICEWLNWKRPNGQLKNHECRLLLERLQRDGFPTLPPLRASGRRGPRQVSIDLDARPPIHATIAELEPLCLVLVDANRQARVCLSAAPACSAVVMSQGSTIPGNLKATSDAVSKYDEFYIP